MRICRTSIVKTFSVVLVILHFHAYEAVRFLYQPTDHSAIEGKRAHITCIFREITDDMDGKYDVIWTKESNIINEPSNGFDLDRFTFLNEYADGRHRLRIEPVRREDGGGYKCHFQYGEEILLISKPGILTIYEIPSHEFPIIKIGKTTYETGEEVKIRCLCEKVNPMAELKWLRHSKMGGLQVGLTKNPGENNTHVWVEAAIPATLKLNGAYFECKMKVKYEMAPRYSISRRLHIIDGSKLLETTSKKTSRQTQQHVKKSLSTNIVLNNNKSNASKAKNDETSDKGIKWIIGVITFGSGVAFGVSIILTILAIRKSRLKHKTC